MKENKTVANNSSVSNFLAALDNTQQRQDSEKLITIMQKVSGEAPVMWGDYIIGFGNYHYKYKSGREGDWMKIGFSPRKGKISLYVTCDTASYKDLLSKLGKIKIGKGCIYIKNLTDVNIEVLTELIKKAYNDTPNQN